MKGPPPQEGGGSQVKGFVHATPYELPALPPKAPPTTNMQREGGGSQIGGFVHATPYELPALPPKSVNSPNSSVPYQGTFVAAPAYTLPSLPSSSSPPPPTTSGPTLFVAATPYELPALAPKTVHPNRNVPYQGTFIEAQPYTPPPLLTPSTSSTSPSSRSSFVGGAPPVVPLSPGRGSPNAHRAAPPPPVAQASSLAASPAPPLPRRPSNTSSFSTQAEPLLPSRPSPSPRRGEGPVFPSSAAPLPARPTPSPHRETPPLPSPAAAAAHSHSGSRTPVGQPIGARQISPTTPKPTATDAAQPMCPLPSPRNGAPLGVGQSDQWMSYPPPPPIVLAPDVQATTENRDALMEARIHLFPLALYGAQLLSVTKGIASTFYDHCPEFINVTLDPQMGVCIAGAGGSQGIHLFFSRYHLSFIVLVFWRSFIHMCSLLPDPRSARMIGSTFSEMGMTITSSCSHSLSALRECCVGGWVVGGEKPNAFNLQRHSRGPRWPLGNHINVLHHLLQKDLL